MLRPNSSPGFSPAIALTVLVSATALVLSPVLRSDFVRLDDYSHLFDNPYLRAPSASGLAAFWTRPYFNLYIPVTYSVWWALTWVTELFGPLRQSAWLFHGLNLSLHLANAALVFAVVRALLIRVTPGSAQDGPARATTAALISALFFAVHPVQVEAVAWISELKGVLSTLFGLLGILWHVRAKQPLSVAMLFVVAMLSKPSAIVFPGIALFIDRVILGRRLRQAALMPALYVLPLLALASFTKRLQSDVELDFIPTLVQRTLVASDALVFYAQKLLVPLSLAPDYGRTPQAVLANLPAWRVALSVMVSILGMAVVLWAVIRRRTGSASGQWFSLVSAGWGILLLSTMPVLGLVPFGFQQFSTVADHYLYSGFLGVTLMIAGALTRFREVVVSRYVAMAVLIAFSVLAHRQARRWHSTETLFTHTLQVNPSSYLSHYCIAQEHLRAGRLDESIDRLTRALAINPHYLTAEIDLGLAWSQQGETQKAVEHYTSVLARRPSAIGSRARLVASIHNNLGLLLLQAGSPKEAVEHFRQAVSLFPRSLNAHLNLGNVALAERRYADAIAEYELLQSLSPGNPAVERRLQRARQLAGQAAR